MRGIIVRSGHIVNNIVGTKRSRHLLVWFAFPRIQSLRNPSHENKLCDLVFVSLFLFYTRLAFLSFYFLNWIGFGAYNMVYIPISGGYYMLRSIVLLFRVRGRLLGIINTVTSTFPIDPI
jgi:hypothetical protein